MKVSIKVALTPSKTLKALPIRLRVSYSGIRPDLRLGYSIEPESWDSETERVIRGRVNKFGQTARTINNKIEAALSLIETIFTQYDTLEDRYPTVEELKEKFYTGIGRAKEKPQAAKTRVVGYIEEFKSLEGTKNGWSEAAYDKFDFLKGHLDAFNPGLTFSDLSEPVLIDWLKYFESNKTRNPTTDKYVSFFKQYLKWCHKNGYYRGNLHTEFRPRLKGTGDDHIEILFLEWEELMTFLYHKYRKDQKYLERARDVYCFCSFSGLRHSDVAKFVPEDLRGGKIRVVTKKTSDGLYVELNDYSLAILEKYKDQEFYHRGVRTVLPVISNQKSNDYLKIALREAGIDSYWKDIYYIGNQRYEDIYKKYEKIGTHDARRTFVVTALYMGISESVIIEWTGHADTSALRPYKKIVNKLKEREMKKFNVPREGPDAAPEKAPENTTH